MNLKTIWIFLAFAGWIAWAAPNLQAQLLKTQSQALKQAFVQADTVLRRTLFLDKNQVERIQKKSRSKVPSRIVSYYVGIKEGRPTGYAFFEKQIVRTKPAIIMVVIAPDTTVQAVEVLAFHEPMDYLPTARWFKQFLHKKLSQNLWPDKEIHAVTGATLSARAFTLMIRRALSYMELIGAKHP
ncbi:MAG: FMN-binding protein [Calditrichaeota bacterium]|nr:MAG: FMN-binding protein [Calditrichota bacterium]